MRLHVDFNYGGRSTIDNKGVVMLHPKSGDRTGMQAHVKAQFDAAGIEPVDGMTVRLVEERADSDDDGTLCDMVVVGNMKVD